MAAGKPVVPCLLVGCGDWGLNYVRVLNELPNAAPTAVYDPDPARLAAVAERYPGLALHRELDQALQAPELQCAIIAAPAAIHYELARSCLERGLHVLVEKPVTTRYEEALELIGLAEGLGRVLMVGHTFLYNDGIRAMKRLLSQSDFGQPYYLQATRTNLGPIRQDVNAAWDLAPHDVSIFNYLLENRPVEVSAVGGQFLQSGREDVAFITLRYPRGVIGNIHVSWADPNKVRKVVAVGSKQRIVFDDLNNVERVKIYEKGVAPSAETAGFGEFRLLVRDGDIISPRIQISEPLKNQCLEFLSCIREGRSPVSDGRFGAEVVRVMEGVSESLAQRGTPVSLVPETQPS